MITLTIMILLAMIGAGLRLAWGATKLVFGLILFLICPILLVLAVLGAMKLLWLPVLLVVLFCGRAFAKC